MTANEQQLMNAYIPPPGALQFERTKPSPTLPEHQEYCWVRPAANTGEWATGSKCEHSGYVLELESLTQANRDWLAANMPTGHIACTCECRGRIIE